MVQTNTKERIISAALELFSAGGYDDVSVEQIASALLFAISEAVRG